MKTPLVLPHGITGTPVMWEPLMPYLRRHHEVHALSIPGHRGGPPVENGDGDLVTQTILDVTTTRDAAPDKPAGLQN